MKDLGIAGRIAQRLVNSPLVPLIVFASLVLGVYGLVVTPREDRPEIEIPTAIVTVAYPGGGAQRVDELVARPIAAWARQLADVVEVTSASSDDAALVVVEFAAGVADSSAFTEITELVTANAALLPPGTGPPTVETFGNEHLAVLTVTLSSLDAGPYSLRRLGEELAGRLQDLAGVRTVTVHGGATRAIQVYPEPAQLAGHRIPITRLAEAVGGSGLRLPADALYGTSVASVAAGPTLASAADVRRVPVGAGPVGTIYLEDVATVTDGPLVGEDAVLHWSRQTDLHANAVTLSVTSVPRQNVSDVTRRVLGEIDTLRPLLIPAEVEVSVGYDAGREATERVYNVLNQLLVGTLIVVTIIWIGLGWRAALVIALMMPTSLAIVPYSYYQLGFTLNPVSIAAMVLAIGILADDTVIMLENMSRLYRVHGERSTELTVRAINEVGNPTILADLLVVVTLLPLVYISGEMGQYVRAIPVGSSIAVLFSLIIALTITPYFGYRLLRPRGQPADSGDGDPDEDAMPGGFFADAYRRLLTPFLARSWARWGLYALMVLLLIAAFSLVALRRVEISLTPVLDREVFVIDLELPPGASLARTLAAAEPVGDLLEAIPEVEAYTIYAGTGGPLLFPPSAIPPVGPRRPHQASIYVQLPPEDSRERLSFEIRRELAWSLPEILAPFSAAGYLRNIPYGPTNDRPLSAEIYAPDHSARLALADSIHEVLAGHAAVTAVERSPAEPLPRLQVLVDVERAATYGVSPAEVTRAVRIALAGETVTSLRVPDARQPVPVMVRLSRERRRSIEDLEGLYVIDSERAAVPLTDVVTIERGDGSPARLRRNLLPLVTVAADIDRTRAQPMTVQADSSERISGLPTEPEVRWISMPENDRDSAVYWGGEWEVTLQVYRDMGIAGVVVMLLIYVLLAGWFSSYTVPVIIMLPIPLIFIGVLPAHWLWGIDVAGMGILGMIALAGIVARNAILLVDFTRQRQSQGMAVAEAVIRAGALRTRPIILTAGTVMFGSGVLIFEPSLEQLGLTLASGVLVATLLTLVLIPVLYFHCYGAGGAADAASEEDDPDA